VDLWLAPHDEMALEPDLMYTNIVRFTAHLEDAMRSVRFVAPALTIFASLVLSGCFRPTSITLEVVTVSPEIDATDVLIDATIAIETSGALDATTVTVETARLFKGTVEAGSTVTAAVTVSDQSITISPAATLDFGTEYTVLITGTVADVDGNLLSGEVSWGFTTKPVTVTVDVGTAAPDGTIVTLDGNPVGSTDEAGVFLVSAASGGQVGVGAERGLFVPPPSQDVALDGSTYDVQFTLDPYIYVPDFTNDRIVRMSSVDAVPATFTVINDFQYGAGPATHTLVGPMWIEVDYDAGIIYGIDAPDNVTQGTFFKLTGYPPAADGSEAARVPLNVGNDVFGTNQFHVMDDGSVILIDFRFGILDGRLVQLPADLDFANAVFGPWHSKRIYGLAALPSGRFLTFGGDISSLDALTLDPFDAAIPGTFGTVTEGSGNNQLTLPSRAIASADGGFVYISDTGGGGGGSNGRIVRYNSDGTGFVSYGVAGTGDGQFFYPEILGILPDNKLYVMDVNNSRVVRIDPGVFDGGAADWAKSDVAAGFSFDYWFFYS